MVLLMGCGIVQTKERIKFLKALLCGRAAHFLGLVQNDDRTVGLDNVNRLSASKVIQFRANTSGILPSRIEGLDVDNHDIDIRALAEVVNLRQVFGIVNKETCLLAIVLHEVILHGLKAFADTFPDSDGGNNHYELTPAVLLIQLEHGFDVNIGLSRTCFHFHIQGAGTQTATRQGLCKGDIIPALNTVHVSQELTEIQPYLVVGKAHVQFLIRQHPVSDVSLYFYIAAVCEAIIKRLTCKNAHHAVHSLRLVRLYGEFEFHCFFSLLFFFAVFSSPFIVSRYASSTGESVCS